MTIGELRVWPLGDVWNWVQVTWATSPLLGSAPTHSLSLKTLPPSAAEVWSTKLVLHVAPPFSERLTATEFALSVRLKARFAYQNTLFGPAATEGSPAAS